MNEVGGWNTYTGSAAFILAAVLLAVSGALAILGARLKQPIAPRRPGKFTGGILALIWLLGWGSFIMAVATYAEALIQQIGPFTPPRNPITPVTLISALATFAAVAILSRHSGFLTAAGSAIAATLAAPMIFELPFDLIVMSRTYPPAPAWRYTLLYFLPLFIISISAFALTTVSSRMNVSRYTLFSLAGMFLVFALWAALGFSYPATPFAIACNAISKVLAFVTAITLFLPVNRNEFEGIVPRETFRAV